MIATSHLSSKLPAEALLLHRTPVGCQNLTLLPRLQSRLQDFIHQAVGVESLALEGTLHLVVAGGHVLEPCLTRGN